jgi:hypothetical protein
MAILSQKGDLLGLLDQLALENILIPRRDAVDQYIFLHCDLGQLLPAICAISRQHFGQDAELSLEVYKDPEIDDQYLTLYVRQTNYPSDIMHQIYGVARQFDDLLEKVSGYLLITTDFRRPRGLNGV